MAALTFFGKEAPFVAEDPSGAGRISSGSIFRIAVSNQSKAAISDSLRILFINLFLCSISKIQR